MLGQGFPRLSLQSLSVTLAGAVELLSVLDLVKLMFSVRLQASPLQSLDSKAVSPCENNTRSFGSTLETPLGDVVNLTALESPAQSRMRCSPDLSSIQSVVQTGAHLRTVTGT